MIRASPPRRNRSLRQKRRGSVSWKATPLEHQGTRGPCLRVILARWYLGPRLPWSRRCLQSRWPPQTVEALAAAGGSLQDGLQFFLVTLVDQLHRRQLPRRERFDDVGDEPLDVVQQSLHPGQRFLGLRQRRLANHAFDVRLDLDRAGSNVAVPVDGAAKQVAGFVHMALRQETERVVVHGPLLFHQLGEQRQAPRGLDL